jgi:hypothetical protein
MTPIPCLEKKKGRNRESINDPTGFQNMGVFDQKSCVSIHGQKLAGWLAGCAGGGDSFSTLCLESTCALFFRFQT